MIPSEGVEIVEIGPRDGLQNLKAIVETETKIQLIHKLAACGFREIQIGGFVNPKAIPQFHDIKDVTRRVLDEIHDVKLTALTPNLRGAQDALECGIRKLNFVFSVSASHNQANVRKNPEESLEELARVVALFSSYPDTELSVDLATVFGCPFEINISKDTVLRYCQELYQLGVRQVTLCDTVGFANPRQVEDICSVCMTMFPDVKFRVHFHNTRGLAQANALAAYQVGIRSFDSAIGGLGGCPFAPGATGNVATEDLTFMFEEMGIVTGLDLIRLLGVSQYLQENVPGAPLESALFKAGLPGKILCSGSSGD